MVYIYIYIYDMQRSDAAPVLSSRVLSLALLESVIDHHCDIINRRRRFFFLLASYWISDTVSVSR